MELEIDLDDGLPPATVKTGGKKATSPAPTASPIHPQMAELKVPTAVVISYQPTQCLGCGAEHRTHLGIFLELKVGGHGRVLQRKTLRELPAYAGLPRRVDIAPPDVIPICIDCWHVQKAFEQAVDVATLAAAEGGPNFGDPAKPSGLIELAHELKLAHEVQSGNEEKLQ